MSFDQGVSDSFFRITYDSASPTDDFLAAPAVSDDSFFNGSSMKIIRAKSFRIHRCRNNSWSIHGDNDCSVQNERECCCNQNEIESRSNPELFEKTSNVMLLALLISPTLTHRFLDSIQSLKNKKSQNNTYDVVSEDVDLLWKHESDFRKSIHPSLCIDQKYYTIYNNSSLKNCTVNETKDRDLAILPHLSIYGILTADCNSFLPADVVLFEPKSSAMEASINIARKRSNLAREIIRYSFLLNHETASDAPWSVLKAFPVCSVSFIRDSSTTEKDSATSDPAVNAHLKTINRKSMDSPALPCCPVCLHRIDPASLGLPGLKHQQKCSRLCLASVHEDESIRRPAQHSCTNEMKLEPWPPPAHCDACGVIRQRNSSLRVEPTSDAFARSSFVHGPSPCLKCHECGMTTTLWVCLTCGVVGCGRYTLKHAADHFTSVGHPYSLELATMRIWDYENGSFAHRRDLLECPVLSIKWGNDLGTSDSIRSLSPLIASSLSMGNYTYQGDRGFILDSSCGRHGVNQNQLNACSRQGNVLLLQNTANGSITTCQSGLQRNSLPDKLSLPSKKSTMVSQEYEALLQSALEDQAMHFEGEISHLRADLASSRIKHFENVSDRDAQQINALRNDRERLKQEIEILSSALLETQTEESRNRALSQKLLREKSIAKELLDKLQKEIGSEHELCKRRMDDLDLQIEDLTANLKMKMQIAKNEELSQAQIFGTVGGALEDGNKKKTRKATRCGRKK